MKKLLKLVACSLLVASTFCLTGCTTIVNEEKSNKNQAEIKKEDEERKESKLNKDVNFVNIPIGITYSIPDTDSYDTFRGGSRQHIFGHKFLIKYNQRIFIEKSLKGSANLETLILDINKEKQEMYGEFSGEYFEDVKINKTKKIKINNMDAILFEGLYTNKAYSEAEKNIIGYSFIYDKQAIAVYGEYSKNDNDLNNEKSGKEYLKTYLTHIISSIEKWDGKEKISFKDNKVGRLYYNGYTNFYNHDGGDIFVMGISDNLITTSDSIIVDSLFLLEHQKNEAIPSFKEEWDGDLNTIVDTIIKTKENFSYDLNFYPDITEGGDYTIKEKSREIIDDTEFVFYDIAFKNQLSPFVLFVVDGIPYIIQVDVDLSKDEIGTYVEENYRICLLETVLTFKKLNEEETAEGFLATEYIRNLKFN